MRQFLLFATSSFLLLSSNLLGSNLLGQEAALAEPQDPIEVVRQLLEQGKEAGDLPPRLTVRLVSRMSGNDKDGKLIEFNEAWEISRGLVHELELVRDEEGKLRKWDRRVSKRFNTSKVCPLLVSTKAADMEDEMGEGEPVLFFGTPYEFGDRSVSILVDGHLAVSLEECCLFPGFEESKAKRLAALYEQLAEGVRSTFSK